MNPSLIHTQHDVITGKSSLGRDIVEYETKGPSWSGIESAAFRIEGRSALTTGGSKWLTFHVNSRKLKNYELPDNSRLVSTTTHMPVYENMHLNPKIEGINLFFKHKSKFGTDKKVVSEKEE